jgi:hypothetical protein
LNKFHLEFDIFNNQILCEENFVSEWTSLESDSFRMVRFL